MVRGRNMVWGRGMMGSWGMDGSMNRGVDRGMMGCRVVMGFA